MDPVPFHRALVVRFGRIGDMLVVTPTLRALRRSAPDARIDLLTSREGRVVFASNPRIDHVHVLQWRRVPRFMNPERAALIRSLASISYDAIFLLEGGERYHTLIADTGASPVYTFAGEGRPPDAHHARRGAHHELQNFFSVLDLAGIEPAGNHYEYQIGETSSRRADLLLETHGVGPDDVIVGIHAGHFQKPRFGRGPHAKTWPVERWSQLVRSMLEKGADHIVLTGSASERSLNAAIAAGAATNCVIDLAGRTDLETLAAVIRRASAFIAPDTGPAHLAAAVDTPLVALFGPKHPDIMGPLGDESRIERLYPQPSNLSETERAGHHPRMWAITVDSILAAISRMGVSFDQAETS